MGRPLNKKYFGVPTPSGTQIACQAWVPGDTMARAGYITRQLGSNSYHVVTSGGEGQCYLVDEITDAEQMVVQAVIPSGTVPAKKISDRDVYTWDGNWWPNWVATGGQLVYEPLVGNYWVAAYGTEPSYAFAEGCTYDSQGNLIATGGAYAGGYYGSVIKISPSGNIIWQKRLHSGSPGGWAGEVVLCDSNDDIYVGAQDWGWPQFISMIKMSSDGEIIWQNSINGYNIMDIAVNSDGSSALAFVNHSDGMRTVARFAADGTVDWQKTFNNDWCQFDWMGIGFTTGNHLAVSARYYNSADSRRGLVVFALDAAGSVVWTTSLADGNNQEAQNVGTAMDTDSSGNIYAQIPYVNYSDGSEGAIFAKLNSSGALQWQTDVNDAGNDLNVWSIIVDGSGNAYSNGSKSGGQSFIKLGSNGDMEWNNLLTNGAYVGAYWSYGTRDMTVYGDSFSFSGFQDFSGDGPEGAYQILTKLPIDGSHLGVKGLYTYEAGTLTANAASWTSGNVTVTPTDSVALVGGGSPFVVESADLTLSVTYF